jgi:acyl-CoA thioesterase-2
MGDFELDTRLERIDESRFRARLSRDWAIWGPSGGYVASIALRAAGLVAKVQRPASFSGHFVSVGQFETVDVEVRTVRAGRRAESFAVSISQQGRPLFESLVRTAAEGPGLEHDVAEIPTATRPDGLKFIQEVIEERLGEEAKKPPFPFWSNFDVKPVRPERFVPGPRRAHDPVFEEWYRFAPRACFDDPFLDAARTLMMIDTASWIAASQPHPESEFIAPNLDVTTWFHRTEPETEWLLVDAHCSLAEAGLMGTHSRIWSESGKLLASGGAQLFCVPAPPA